ncbi:asparagine synthetase [Nesidiocoris tenuis]|uniref:Asparagine synthetase [glutamine-hydrolyzing] n=1 Tax=Nesidiocoris tenuis TaxID=355587 RepID=A0ABN7B2X9_9HEMI|nr:asparagine synthetase [Nesidiocoris tenuis]
MCGIWALFGYESESLQHCDCSFYNIRHRGPDAWRLQYDNKLKNVSIGFVRLSIVDSVYGMQPMILHAYPHLTLICNGELYNFKRLGEEMQFNYETKCDVEVIIQMFARTGSIEETVRNLDGVFAFALIDTKNRKLYIARDPYGVRPLYRMETDCGILGISSEGKGLIRLGKDIMNGGKWSLKQFPPRSYATYDLLDNGRVKLVETKQYYKVGDRPAFPLYVKTSDLGSDVYANIRTLLTASVRKRLMAERRIGCLLSGGLDSSLIAALLVKLAKEENLPYKIQSFSIGMGSSPDLVAARQVAKHLGTDHHELIFTEDDVADVLDSVLWTLETFDITTVRASIGMYLLSRYIKKETNTTVIMSGEGADELLQGYIYFREAPSIEAAHQESLRLLEDIYLYDGLRADRTTSAHSLELRVPFLDLQFTHYVLNLPIEMRKPVDGIEKHLLRKAFSDTGLIPDNILWRHKEAFSDGVASKKKSLFEVIREITAKRLKSESSLIKENFKHLPPKDNESLYYRKSFDKSYPGQAENLTPYFWMPKWVIADDPSARFLPSYAADTELTD